MFGTKQIQRVTGGFIHPPHGRTCPAFGWVERKVVQSQAENIDRQHGSVVKGDVCVLVCLIGPARVELLQQTFFVAFGQCVFLLLQGGVEV